jgi:hypothetical protein
MVRENPARSAAMEVKTTATALRCREVIIVERFHDRRRC